MPLNFGLYLGFEHIFDKGLPGLGIGAEYGVNGLVLLPKNGDTTFVVSGGGFGPGASFANVLLLSIRYYFLDHEGAKPARADEAATPEVPAAPAVRPSAVASDARDLWNAIAPGESGTEACDQVFEVLSKDESCAGEQCRGPRMLSAVYLARCGKAAPDDAAKVQGMRERWLREAPGDAGSRCYQALLRAARSKEAARNYAGPCLASRSAGYFESILIGDTPMPKAKPKKEETPPKDPPAQPATEPQ